MSDAITITLSDEDWALALSAMILLIGTSDASTLPERDAIAQVGRSIADQCPKGSAAWFGGALFPPANV